jgi:hypothetical protein
MVLAAYGSGQQEAVIFSQVYHTHNARVCLAIAAEILVMDAIYLLMLAGLYVLTHGLVLALNRLGKSS